MKKNTHKESRKTPSVIRSKNGSALILVISVILLLTMFGTVSLFASLANMRMSSRYSNWSEEYFSSDANLEEILSKVDGILKTAEDYTGDYMEKQYFKFTSAQLLEIVGLSSDKPSLAIVRSMMVTDSTAQTFFNDHGFKWDSYAEYYDSVPKDNEGNPVGAYMSENDYFKKLEETNKDMYERLYFYFSHTLISLALQPTGSLQTYIASSQNNIEVKLNSDLSKVFTDTFKYDKNDWKININSTTGSTDNRHTVKAVLSIKYPDANTIISTINNPVYGNPLWGYALAAEGNINFSSSATVYGDVFAASNRDNTYEGAIDIQGNSNVSINGNIYTNGDITALGSGAKLTVNSAATSSNVPSYSKKQKIYGGSSLLMNQADLKLYDGGSGAYTEGSSDTGIVPLLYQDAKGGNVYCHDFKVNDFMNDGNPNGALMKVTGNLITSDDIEMDGPKSNIILDGNFVGINSVADKAGTAVNPNATSAIINNRAADASSINLKGNIIVPGIAYAEYEKGSDTNIEGLTNYYFYDDKTGKIYYPTVESVTTRDQSTFDYYLALDDGGDTVAFYLNGVKYCLKELSAVSFENKLNSFTSSGISSINSHIFLKDLSNINGYSLGAVITDATLGGEYNGKPVDLKGIIASYGPNMKNYYTAEDQLKRVQAAKTEYFGYNDPTCTMSDLINADNDDNVYYFNGFTQDSTTYSSGTLNISGNMNGIIYSTGDLTLTGSGTFSGVILSKGNITVQGNVKIIYSEDVVNKIMSDSKSLKARAFFKPGCEYGKKYGSKTYTYYEDYDSTSGIKTETKRYRIESWLEGTE